jgi:hypothetical protein
VTLGATTRRLDIRQKTARLQHARRSLRSARRKPARSRRLKARLSATGLLRRARPAQTLTTGDHTAFHCVLGVLISVTMSGHNFKAERGNKE